MKNFGFLFALLLLFSACSEDFKVGADYKNVTIVYGLLDDGAIDNTHYIKIARGFFSETENNILIAKNKDSIYFADIDVTIEESRNGGLLNTYTLNEVDLNTILADQKQEGIFLDSPNIAYRFVADLDPENLYKLVITNNETGEVVTGETSVIGSSFTDFKINYPFTAFDRLIFDNPSDAYTFDWNAPDNSTLFDIILRFYYWEENINTQVQVNKFVDLPLGKFIEYRGTRMNYIMNNQDFYSLLVGSIPPGGVDVLRYVDTPQLRFVAGGAELQQYIEVNSAQGGLTSDQIKPNFTNMQGENVLGIFSTRATRVVGFIPYSDPTWDSISNGSLTRNLNFVGRSGR